MNRYTWHWKGNTPKGTCGWKVFDDGSPTEGTPWTSDLENDITEKAKATYYATMIGEFQKKATEQGISVTLISVDVQCTIAKDPLQQQHFEIPWWYAWKGKSRTEYQQRFVVFVEGTVKFDSLQDFTASPIAPALIIVIAFAVAIFIASIGVAWGIYTFLNNLTLNQTTSEIITEYYDENGNLIKKVTEKTTTQKPTTSDPMTAVVVVGGLLIFAALVLPELLKPRQKQRRR